MIEEKKVKLSNTGKPIKPTNPNQTENQGGRPSKMKNFVEAFEQVLQDNESDVIYLTDEELRITCNDLLEEDAQISESTFESWKAGKLKDNPEYERFMVLYKKALTNQKRNLFKVVQTGENNWQARSWIIERKFSEWNLRQITENTNKNTNTNMTLEVEDKEELKDILKDNDLI